MTVLEFCCMAGTAFAFACLLFLDALRRRAARAEISLLERVRKNEDALAALEERVRALHQLLEEVRSEARLMVAPEPPKSGFNLNRRSEALRLLRRGDTAEQISSALGVPMAEVVFLEKVQRILLENCAAGTRPPATSEAASEFAAILAEARVPVRQTHSA